MNLMWFRRDLRISDNPALYESSKKKNGVIAIYIASTTTWQTHHMGLTQQHWIQQNLNLLDDALQKLNIPLLIYHTKYFSDCPKIIKEICNTYNISELYFNYEYEWDERRRDSLIFKKLGDLPIKINAYHDQCLIEPNAVLNKQGKPYSVFTPYKKTCIEIINTNPSLIVTNGLPLKQPAPLNIKQRGSSWSIITPPTISGSLLPGEKNSHKILNKFIATNVSLYHKNRDFPGLDSTSRLSAYLAIGVISVRQCITAIMDSHKINLLSGLFLNQGISTWISELIWRDFYKMICFQFPQVSRNQPFQRQTSQLKWHHNQNHFDAWCEGQTGVPIIDAAMRQLNQTGWMHNRLRMIVAMYLTKNLWLDWRLGEAYFAEKLIDWDFTANNGGWQWSASTGNDAAPYFRVFNPISQSERFDPEGNFIKEYCPELRLFDSKQIHNPHQKSIIQKYPKPLVDLKKTRQYAIEQFKKLKK